MVRNLKYRVSDWVEITISEIPNGNNFIKIIVQKYAKAETNMTDLAEENKKMENDHVNTHSIRSYNTDGINQQRKIVSWNHSQIIFKFKLEEHVDM